MTTPLPSKPRWPAIAGDALIVMTALIAFFPAITAGFVWDDDAILTANPFVQASNGLRYIWFSTALPDYFPLTSTSLWLEWRLWGMNATGYHVTNILLHALGAMLLWRVLRQLKIPAALLIALVFAIHPVNVESVAWITQRKNTLSFLFYALALWAYLRFDFGENASRRRWYVLAVIAFLLALLGKTSVVMLPFVLLLCAWWKRNEITRRDLLRSLPFFALSLAFGLLTVWFQYHRAIGEDVVLTENFAARLAGAGSAVWFYLFKAVLPLDLSFVYPRWEIDPRSVFSYLPGVAIAGLFLLFWWKRAAWGRPFLFGFGYFVLSLLPVLGFLDIYFMRYSRVADHWQYIAIIGVIALVIGGAAHWVSRRAVPRHRPERAVAVFSRCNAPAFASATLLVVILGALTWRQSTIYASAETLWQDTLEKNPNSWLAHNNLGLVRAAQGEFDRAREHYLESLRLQPVQVEAHNNLGEVFLMMGQVEEAKREYLEVLKINPNLAMAHYNLGNAFDREGQTGEAIAAYRRALELQPTYPDAHNNLGCLLALQGSHDEAIAHFQETLNFHPDHVDALNNLGSTLLESGRPLEALVWLGKVLQVNPGFVDAHYNLGNAHLALGNARDAFQHYSAAIQLNPNMSVAHYKLAGIFLAGGRPKEAAHHYSAVLRIHPENAEAHYQLAVALAQIDETEKAVFHFRHAVRLKPDWIEALNNLAWILATSAKPDLREAAEAIRLAEQAVKLTGERNPGAMDTLAAAYAEAGRFSEAVKLAQRAARLAQDQGQADLARHIADRERLYASKQRYREP